MKKNISTKKLCRITFWTLAVWVLLQLFVVILYWNSGQGPDAQGYMRNALQCFAIGSTYPSVQNIYDQYLQSPGMVNYLLLQHICFGTTSFSIDKVLNILMNIGIVFNIYYLARRFFDLSTAYISVILYCLLPTNLFAPTGIQTELPYLFLAITGLSLSLNRNGWLVILASLLYGLAHTFRPLVLAFLVVSVVVYLIEKRSLRYYFLVVVPYLLVLYGIGIHNKANTGYFVNSSTTGGYNLIMTANDRALARPEFSIFDDSTNIAYIPNRQSLTFAEKDSVYKTRAIKWITEHPFRYMVLYVEKIGRLWSGDTWSIPIFSQWDNYDYIRTLPNPGNRVLIRRLIQAIEGLPYYVLVFAFLITLYKRRREALTLKGVFFLLVLLGTAGTCLFTVEVRFHYPYLFCLVLWAAYGIRLCPLNTL